MVLRFFFAVMVSGVVASFTDWLFMGALFHGKYLATPEIWRLKAGKSETRPIIFSFLLGLLSSAGFLCLAVSTGAFDTYNSTLRIVVLVLISGAVPIILTNVLWIKMHPALGFSHSMGWLARFVVTGVVGRFFLH